VELEMLKFLDHLLCGRRWLPVDLSGMRIFSQPRAQEVFLVTEHEIAGLRNLKGTVDLLFRQPFACVELEHYPAQLKCVVRSQQLRQLLQVQLEHAVENWEAQFSGQLKRRI
jgi:hypothetical protein